MLPAPSTIAYSTEALNAVCPVLVTVKVRVPAVSSTSTSATANCGRSSLVPPVPVPSSLMVPTPVPSPMRALVGLERLRSRVSERSKIASLVIGTVTVLVVSPAVKVSVPLVAV